MAKRKQKTNNSKGSGSFNLWVATKIIALLAVGYLAGWSFGYSAGRDDGRAEVGAPTGDEANTDAFGRSPGHPHYGHSHG
jgi:hypothetical protein